MVETIITELPEGLRDLQERWIQSRREEQDLIYSREFGPAFARLFAGLPLNGWMGERPHFRALVSVLGLSWQPVALMAAWVKPEHLLILGTDDSLAVSVGKEPVLEVLSRISGLPLDRLIVRKIGDREELDIYREVRDFIRTYAYGPHEIAIDPTGGKKSMSASAALAGFLTGAWIVYVDYARYHPEKRIPIAGTEYPRLLGNPLEVFGELEFKNVNEAYRRGNYDEALHLAENLATRLYEPREAQALALLAKAFGAWQRFNFREASESLEMLRNHLQKFALYGRWVWGNEILPKISNQCVAIKRLAELTSRIEAGWKPESMQEGIPFVLNHLTSAERALTLNQIGVSVLLVYSTLERYLDLILWVNYGLDDEKPDYGKVEVNELLFHSMGEKLHGKKYEKRVLSGPLTLSLGVQLLATLRPDLLPEKYLGPIRGLMQRRNKCEFEHGLSPKLVSKNEVLKDLKTVKEIIQNNLSCLGGALENQLANYSFPMI